MQMVICPNGGRCGSRKHRLGTKAYQQCFEQFLVRDGQAKPGLPAPTHASLPKQSCAQYIEFFEMMREQEVYSAADSLVTKDMVIQDDMVKTYINNPDEANALYHVDLVDQIHEDIEENSADILAELDLYEDDLDSVEFNIFIEAAYDADESDIAGAMAKNMEPRIFSLASVHDENEKRGALYFANQSGDVGSDEWFDELGSMYHKYAREYGLIDKDYDSPDYDESQRTDLQESITSLLKNAIRERGEEVNSADGLPDLSVVWKGSLHDIAPAYEDENFFTIESPYLVARYKDAGVVGEPIPIRGYRTPFAGKAEREWGAYSGITDEATSDKAIFSPAKRGALDLRESKVSMGDYLAPRE